MYVKLVVFHKLTDALEMHWISISFVFPRVLRYSSLNPGGRWVDIPDSLLLMLELVYNTSVSIPSESESQALSGFSEIENPLWTVVSNNNSVIRRRTQSLVMSLVTAVIQ